MFDERKLTQDNIRRAIERYVAEEPKHHRARSAFLLADGKRLPAKLILRFAFEDLTGTLPAAEQLTGGRASVRVLKRLGFDAIYDKPNKSGERNPIKNARRHAFKQVLADRFGAINIEERDRALCVPDLSDRANVASELLSILSAVESCRGLQIKGRTKHCLACDFYLPDHRLIIEFDERQHFTPLRAAALRAYPRRLRLGFDKERWIALCEEIRAGDNSPIYRDEQRAFYDSIRDIMAPKLGFKPVVRVFESDVLWEQEPTLSRKALAILRSIDALIRER
ncbi:MAG: hypothetical protein H0X34_04915 [Chthoniobacterales bacterium]|nr:hypothetical protein [Chthoniobacterales bacterium]